jgi:hypothetical protein
VIHDVDSSISNLRVSTLVGDARLLTGHAVATNDDLVIANRQNATIFGDAFEMTGHARAAGDFISANGEFTAVAYGDALHMSGQTVGGNDDVMVSGGDTAVGYGDALTLSNHARGGDDQLVGTSPNGRVALYGDAQTLRGHAQGGDDLLIGHTANTTWGLQGSDLYGDGQVLADHAHGGNDTLISGQGADDRMWGDAATVGPHAGAGADVFEFQAANGHDVIEDFQHGLDHIELHQTAYHSFADLAGVIQQTAQGELLAFDASNSILVAGVHQLGAGDFVFT